MTTICVPPMEAEPWPTLGPGVVAKMEADLVFGPGDLLGEPYRLNGEQKGLIYRLYEVHPRCSCWGTRRCLEAHRRRPGPRRFKRAGISLRKGLMKTELMAAIAYVELAPESPVRCVSWWKPRGGEWEPEGGPVTDPYIPLLATSEEQVERLAFGALYEMISRGRCARDFDIGLERIMRLTGDGVCEPVSTAPNQRDGARTTFQGIDESHRLTLPNQKAAVQTMLNNIPKRPLADPWTCETTTSYAPGQGSVAQDTMDLAVEIVDGRSVNPQFFFFHRQASKEHDLKTQAGLRAAVIEATGDDAMAWSDVEGIVAIANDPKTDMNYWCRVWLNQATGVMGRAFSFDRWQELSRSGEEIAAGRLVTLGFDGARTGDSTALVATDVESGLQQVVGFWENSQNSKDWKTPEDEVLAAVEHAFAQWEVWRMYADPPYWESELARWAGEHGDKVVIAYRTNRWSLFARALQAYANAISEGAVTNDGHVGMARHVGNGVRVYTTARGDQGEYLWIIQKERADSPLKIDAAVAGCLSWQARLDAVASGVLDVPEKWHGIFIPEDEDNEGGDLIE